MEVVKKTDDYRVIKKRSGRYGVQNVKGGWINGDDKAKILAEQGLIKLSAPRPAEAAAPEEAAE